MIVQKAGERLNIDVYNKILNSIVKGSAYNKSARFSLVRSSLTRDFTIYINKKADFDSGILQVIVEIERNGILITAPIPADTEAKVEDKFGNSANYDTAVRTETKTYSILEDNEMVTYFVKLRIRTYALDSTGIKEEHLVLKFDDGGATIENMFIFTKKPELSTSLDYLTYNTNMVSITELIIYIAEYLNTTKDNRGLIQHTTDKDLANEGLRMDFSSIKSSSNLFEYLYFYAEDTGSSLDVSLEDGFNITKVKINDKYYKREENIFILSATATPITKTYSGSVLSLNNHGSYTESGTTYYKYEFFISKEITYTEISKDTEVVVVENDVFKLHIGDYATHLLYASAGHFMGTPITNMAIGTELLQYASLDTNTPITQKMINDIATLFNREYYRDIDNSVTAEGGNYYKYKRIPFKLRLEPNDLAVDPFINVTEFGITWKIEGFLQEGSVFI